MTKIVNMNSAGSFRLKWIEATAHINQGALSKALLIFEELAAEGYSEAYIEIGNIFERGLDGHASQNLDAARSWYMKAVEENCDPYGYIGLARLALSGYTEAGTYADAIDFLNVAAQADNPVAFTMLGSLYHSGKLVPKNLDAAVGFYEKACMHGYVLPAVYLANIYWERGCYWTALKMRMKTIWIAYSLARKDRGDPRLWNYL